ncbi:MAG TPA: hypothetical protein VIZ66_00785 [Sphingomicrobium sp.]
MPAKVTIDRLKRDREKLRGALLDYKSGKAGHLADDELAGFIASLERRIAALDAQIEGPTET